MKTTIKIGRLRFKYMKKANKPCKFPIEIDYNVYLLKIAELCLEWFL